MPVADDLTAAERSAFREELEQLEKSLERHPALDVTQQLEELDRAMLWYAGNAADCLRTVDALNHDGLGTRLLMEGEVPYGDDLHRNFVTE